MSKLTYVSSTDGEWCGVYIDGKLDYETHTILVCYWLDVINVENLTQAENFEIDGHWLEDQSGYLPLLFKDIPEDKLS